MAELSEHAAALSIRLEHSERLVASLSLSLIDMEAGQRSFDLVKAAALADRECALVALARSQDEYRLVTGSRSWRLTAPLRQLMTLLLALRARTKHRQSGEPTKAPGTNTDIAPLPISRDAENILARFPAFDAADPGKDPP